MITFPHSCSVVESGSVFFFLNKSVQNKIQKIIKIARSAIFFEHGQFFFELENREAVLGLFFELFFEGHQKSPNIFLKACSKFYF